MNGGRFSEGFWGIFLLLMGLFNAWKRSLYADVRRLVRFWRRAIVGIKL